MHSYSLRRFCLSALVLLVPGSGAPPELDHLVVIHTNDLHGQVLPRPATWLEGEGAPPDCGGLERLAACVESLRSEARQAGLPVLVVDAGDWFQGTPEGRLDRGRGYLRLLAKLEYDALAVGNHDLDHGPDVLAGHLRAVRLPALLANARLRDGSRIPGTQPYRIVRRGNLRIALVGLGSVHTPRMTRAGAQKLVWREPAEVLSEITAELAGRVDWILPITHQGVGADRELARAHPELDLIVGGHSHSLLRHGVREGKTLVVQAGSGATAVGRVDLWFDPRTKRVVKSKASLIQLYDLPDPRFARADLRSACERLVRRSGKRMDEVVGHLTAPLVRGRERTASSSAGNLVSDLMRAHAGAQVALLGRSGLRADLPAGPVTRRALFSFLPFDDHLLHLSLTGAELLEVLRAAVEDEGGSGFALSGLTLELRRGRGKPRLAGAAVGGTALDPEHTYRVVIDSFSAGGGARKGPLGRARRRGRDSPLLRELVERAFDGGRLTPSRENRFRRVR
ncbi:MAG: bifunctional UDP-sugar hydrolase/5'-nucleotidase [Planctomycetota bacterium]